MLTHGLFLCALFFERSSAVMWLPGVKRTRSPTEGITWLTEDPTKIMLIMFADSAVCEVALIGSAATPERTQV